ncbi:L2 [Cervus elaphus papillomavirus 1]|uniref:Minor capsid protein L2 n=8 Tax=Papillomaviridae TaxID=151340 RepID=I3RWK1_9PAPI|nr:L2 [Cervus elaphus papillomavirus 1]QIQ60730.1 L2 [Cervus elaphus papillomavirus 1]QIQ60739.1 L2 [Cervus elaphus papillomavirus 1]QNR09200.1 L2 [Cervus elaphus papillomavirus 1]
MPPLKRVKRANVYDLYRTCKQAGTCPADVIPKVEGKTVADKILQYGSLGVYLGGLGIGTGMGKAPPGGYVPLRGGGSSASLPSNPFAGGIPLETLETLGSFRPGIIEDAGPLVEGTVPDAPAVIIPESVPVDEGLSGLDVSSELSTDTAITFISAEGADDIAVLEVRPTEHLQPHVMSRSNFQNPLYQPPLRQASVIADTSGSENILVGGSGIGSQSGESIELSTFNGPRTSTPAQPFQGRRGIFNWFSKRYYTQVPVEDPDEIAAAGSYVFENPVYDSKAYKPEQQLDTLQPALESEYTSAARILQGPSGRIGVSRVARPTSIGTRSGVRVGPLYHLRHSLSTIDEPVSLELLPLINEDSEVITSVIESHLGNEDFEDIDLESFDSDMTLFEPMDHHISQGAGGRRRLLLPVTHTRSLGVGAIYTEGPGTSYEDTEYVNENGGHGSTPTVVIDGNIHLQEVLYRQYFLHPSLLKRKRRKRLFG